MLKFLKILSIAIVGVAIGTVASKLVRSEKARVNNTKPAPNQNNQLRAEKTKDSRNDLDDDLDNCFI